MILIDPAEKIGNELPLGVDQRKPILVLHQKQPVDEFRDNLDSGSELLRRRIQVPETRLEQGNCLGRRHCR